MTKEVIGQGKHTMKLNPLPFKQIKEGTKLLEVRLNDEKRQNLCVNDEIIFTNTENGAELKRTICSLELFDTFKSLFQKYRLNPSVLGCDENYTESEFVAMMQKYYSIEEEKKFGVLAIGLL